MKDLIEKYKQVLITGVVASTLGFCSSMFTGIKDVYNYPQKDSVNEQVQTQKIHNIEDKLSCMVSKEENDRMHLEVAEVLMKIDDKLSSNEEKMDKLSQGVYRVMGIVEGIKTSIKYPPVMGNAYGNDSTSITLTMSK